MQNVAQQGFLPEPALFWGFIACLRFEKDSVRGLQPGIAWLLSDHLLGQVVCERDG